MVLFRALAGALAATLLALGAPRAAEPSKGAGEIIRDVVEGGRHIQLSTEHGAVHLWRPPRYNPETAGILIYVHGYFTDVDRAFAEHHLAAQFRQSHQNALFIVPEAPSGKGEDVFWKDLGLLIQTVGRLARIRIPDGPVVVLGHSGAYRTIAAWLDYRRLDEIILLDALYAYEDEFRAWIDSGPRHVAKKLVIVSIETAARSEAFVLPRPLATKVAQIPDRLFDLSRGRRNAQVIYMKSQLDHMALVTEGHAIPLLLRLTPFGRL